MTSIRPVDAAAVLLLDRSGGSVRVLVGRRSSRHIFMPGVYVFPGGRRDAADRHVRVAGPLHPLASQRLALRAGTRCGETRVRALGVAALRELYEEAGLGVGAPSEGILPFRPDLSRLRFLARAITPPGLVRRYDTRFFTLFTDEAAVDPARTRASHELEDLRWVDIFDPAGVDMPDITRMILEELQKSIQEDPSLPFGRAVPLYHTPRGRFVRELL